MTPRVWRAWSAACVVAATVVVPLFVEVFAGGSPVRFAALPLRWAWMAGPVRGVLAAGWLPPRPVALVVAGGVLLLASGTGVDLAGLASLHPGWFLTLEWWQRALWPYLDLLPRALLGYRPIYLWVAWGWTVVEGAVAAVLLWRLGDRPGR